MIEYDITIDTSRADAYFKALPSEIQSAIRRANIKSGLRVERESKLIAPVDTGRLRNTISPSMSVGGGGVIIGAYTEYARFVHDGTRFMKGRPFLTDAVRASSVDIKDYYVEEISNALK